MAFAKILIANRGEIAVRIIRTARTLGYRTVAVYTDVDRDQPHAALADQAVPLGAPQAYLDGEAILAAARRSGADAVHPGYGFLSENADFAAACSAAGLVFIGPPAAAIRSMGDKAAAKRQMAAAGVPCLPGYHGDDQDDATLLAAATAIGFPLMVKAAAGGGGRGMRLVAGPDGLAEALAAARREAWSAFADGRLILERAVAAARHVEVQVFADAHGNAIHLNERDCSLQRRHQKVIEEAPSPALTGDLRRQMGEAALLATRTVGYVGAGTVEFLLEADGRFHFLEMNTRLQVEHPVTELITGQDLVAWQIAVAKGEPLPLRQDEVPLAGHAIEARLYAEDAWAGFLPQAGRVLAWDPPPATGVRIDHGLAPGVTISPYYDPLLAKVVAHGATREAARRRLAAALQDLVVLGIETNRAFLLSCLADPEFVAGRTGTTFVTDRAGNLAAARPAADGRLAAVAAALIAERQADPAADHGPPLGGTASPMLLQCGDRRISLSVSCTGRRQYRIAAADAVHDVAILAAAGARIRVLADGLAEEAHVAWDGNRLHLDLGGTTALFADVLLAPPDAVHPAAGSAATAPMAGTVTALRVAIGEPVRRGQCLVVLEAMKMQHEIGAPLDGRIRAVRVVLGEQVPARQVLIEIEPAEGESSP